MVTSRNALVSIYDGLARYHDDRGEYPAGQDDVLINAEKFVDRLRAGTRGDATQRAA